MIISLLDPDEAPRTFRRPHANGRGHGNAPEAPPGRVDLAWLSQRLRARVGNKARGYLPGLTRLRNAVARELRCSLCRAESLVAQLRARGFLVYEGSPRDRVDERRLAWRIAPGV